MKYYSIWWRRLCLGKRVAAICPEAWICIDTKNPPVEIFHGKSLAIEIPNSILERSNKSSWGSIVHLTNTGVQSEWIQFEEKPLESYYEIFIDCEDCKIYV